MLLRLDVALRGEPRADEGRADALAEAPLGEDQEVVRRAPEHDEGRDDPRLRRQEQGLARVAGAERLHVVRDHRLKVRRGVGSSHGNEVAGAAGHTRCRDAHAD